MKPNYKTLYMRSFGLTLAFMALIGLNAQSPVTMSLKQAMEYAEKNSPAYLNAETDVKIAEQTVQTIKSAGLPQVNASAGYTDYLQIPGSYVKNFLGGQPEYLFFRFSQKYSANASIGMNQLLFDGTYFLGLRAAKDYVDLSQTMVSKSRADLHMNVAKAYLLALTTAKNIELINSNIAVIEKSYNDISALFEQGFAEKLDVQRLQLALSNLKVQKQKLENAVTITQNLLKLQMGMDVNTVLTLTDDLETVNSTIPLADASANAFNVKNRIEHRILTQSIGLSYMDERRYKLGYYPSLVGFVQHQRVSNRSDFNWFQSNLTPNNDFIPSTVWGLNLAIPVFDGLRKHSQIQDVRLRREKTLNDLRFFENAANMEFNNARTNYEVNLRQAAELKLNMDLAKEIYDKANIKFNEGVGSSLEIVQAETELKTAQTNYMNALYDLAISKLEFKKSTGSDLMN